MSQVETADNDLLSQATPALMVKQHSSMLSPLFNPSAPPEAVSEAQTLLRIIALRELGLPITAIGMVYVIRVVRDGMVNVTVSVHYSLTLAALKRSGVKYDFRFEPDEVNPRAVTMGVELPDGKRGSVSYTMEEAERSGLIARNQNWRKMPREMLLARVIARAARTLVPEIAVSTGESFSSTPDEAFTYDDEHDGRRAIAAATTTHDRVENDRNDEYSGRVLYIPETWMRRVNALDIKKAVEFQAQAHLAVGNYAPDDATFDMIKAIAEAKKNGANPMDPSLGFAYRKTKSIPEPAIDGAFTESENGALMDVKEFSSAAAEALANMEEAMRGLGAHMVDGAEEIPM